MKLTHLQAIAEYLNQFDYITKARRVADNTIELGFRSQELGVRVREQSVGVATSVADDYATEVASPRSKTVGRGVPTQTNEPDNLETQDSSLSGSGEPDLHGSLFFDLTRGHSTIYIAPSERPQQGYNAPFDGLLNSQVSKAKLLKVEMPPDDRILRFHLAPKSSYKDKQIILQLEFTGRNTNAILLDENGVVIEALRHIDSSKSYRVVQPGVELAELPSRGLTPLQEQSVGAATSVADIYATEVASPRSPNASLNSEASTLNPEPSTQNHAHYNEIQRHQRGQVIHDSSLRDESQITRPLADIEQFLSENYHKLHTQKLTQSKQNKASATKKQIAKFDRLLKKLSDPEKLLKQSEEYQNIANVLLANLHRIKQYDKILEAEDFEGRRVTIELPKNVPVNRMGEHYFNLSKRARSKAKNVHIEHENLESKKLFYENILNAIENATNLRDLELLVPKRAKAQRKKEKIKEGELFWIEDFKVIVGRNSTENQHLLKIARANDLWMHVRGIPSSHVLIKTDKQNLPENVIRSAAKLCVDFSIKNPGDYDVDYTKRKFVKIQEGSHVEYDKYQTIRVRKEGVEIRN